MKIWLSLAALLFVSTAQADSAVPAALAPEPPPAPKYHPKHGEITLGNNLAKLKVPDEFGYLDPGEAATLLAEWGNPKGQQTLGMLVPMGDGDDDWGVVVTYDDDGHVGDDDAEKIDYDDLLKTMRKATAEHSQERLANGYPPVTLVGWAAAPHYDKASRKLYWAKELAFGEHPNHTLNYNIRVLGKEGVLNLNAVAAMNQLESVQKEMPKVLAFVEFQPGNRYLDFDPKTGRLAAYGIAGLVAGQVAMKAGLFKGLLAVLIAAKKLVIAGVAALGAFFSKLFKRNKNG